MIGLSVSRTRRPKSKLLPVSVNRHLTDLNTLSQLSRESVPQFRSKLGLLNLASNSRLLSNLAVLPNSRIVKLIKRLNSFKRS